MRSAYTLEQKVLALAALAANAGNFARTARQLDIPRSSLQRWAAQQKTAGADGQDRAPKTELPGRAPGTPLAELIERAKGDLADRFEDIARRLLEALPGKLADASLRDIAVALGIAIDKMLLLRGQPDRSGSLTDAERVQRLRALAERVRHRQAGGGVPDGSQAAADQASP